MKKVLEKLRQKRVRAALITSVIVILGVFFRDTQAVQTILEQLNVMVDLFVE